MECLVFGLGMSVFVGAFAFWLFAAPHFRRELDGPQPVVLQTSMSGFFCRISSGGGRDDDTLLLCDPHELVIRVPRVFGRTEHRIPLSSILFVRAWGKGRRLILQVQSTDVRVEVPAGGHQEGSVEELADRIMAVASTAERHEVPDELVDLVSDAR